ncbi:MAG: Coenzyme F420 hydrogenase/dehydrogenase, beta subunit C-terminal domain [Candidatus Aminicenantes bacterium]|nr:Coenzyme F420 hydrogenase/dehydrogenase, beta subunit C-terminal domain [Candidatus Aminicenantes bacterium]
MRLSRSVQEVVDNQLCTQCGTCVSVCPVQAIEMRETPAGMLVASVQEEKCDQCGLCRLVCSGADFEMEDLENIDPFKGRVLKAYVGHAGNEAIRASGQSGGVVSALLLFLLENRRIDSALITSMPADGSLRPHPILARTKGEILAAQGSKYCPVAPSTLLGRVENGERIAAVGIPCQMHGIYKLSRHRNPLASGIKYKIGLFCDRTLFYSCIEQMARKAHLKMKDVAGLEYRSKSRNGWPGEVCFHLVSGEKRFFSPSLRSSLKEFFTPLRCRLCFDKLNVFCDLSVGDAWGISESAKGDSVILARNEAGNLLIRDAMAQGFLETKEIDAELVFNAQNIEKRRLDFSSFMKLYGRGGHLLPEYKGLMTEFLKAGNKALDAQNKRRLNYSLDIAGSATKENALARARAWQRKQKRDLFFASLLGKLKGWIRALCAGDDL